MLEHLFGSKTRYKLIRLFFRHPDTPFFVRELTRVTGVQINAIRRELQTLLLAGIVKEMEPDKNEKWEAGAGLRRYYVLDSASLLFSELQSLLLKDEIMNQEQFMSELKEKGGDIKIMLVTGQFTADKTAPSDMLIIGNLKEKNIAKIIADYEKDFGAEIRYTTMSEKEFSDRRRVMDKFIFALFEAKHMMVINEANV